MKGANAMAATKLAANMLGWVDQVERQKECASAKEWRTSLRGGGLWSTRRGTRESCWEGKEKSTRGSYLTICIQYLCRRVRRSFGYLFAKALVLAFLLFVWRVQPFIPGFVFENFGVY